MKFLVWAFWESVFNKIAVAVANCDHQNSKLRRVAGAEGFWVSGLRVQQLKIGRKSCFGNFSGFYTYLAFAYENLTTFGNYKSGNTGMKPLSLSATRHDFPVPTPRRCCGLLCYCSNQLTSFVSSFKEIWLSSFFAKKLFSQKYFLLKT